MRDTYIDKIDNVDEIFEFITYEEYLELPAFKKYMAERNMPANGNKVEEKPAVPEKKKANASAILTGIFGSIFILWCVIGIFVDNSVFALFGGKNLIEIIKGLTAGSETNALIGSVAMLLAVVFELVFGVIIAFTRVKKEGTGALVKIGTFIAFALVVCSAVMEITATSTVNAGVAVTVVITLIAFFISMTKDAKKTEKKGGQQNG